MKRYAIVRVDTYCPSKFADNVKNEYVCEEINSNEEEHDICGKCRYGDTKEQMIKKVLTAIHTLTSHLNRGDTTFISHETMARRIVEFLGIKD